MLHGAALHDLGAIASTVTSIRYPCQHRLPPSHTFSHTINLNTNTNIRNTINANCILNALLPPLVGVTTGGVTGAGGVLGSNGLPEKQVTAAAAHRAAGAVLQLVDCAPLLPASALEKGLVDGLK